MDRNDNFFQAMEEELHDSGVTSAYEANKAHSPRTAGGRLLEQIRSAEGEDCFGGRLLRSTDRYGNPVLCFAVPNMSESELAEACRWYGRMSYMSMQGFLHLVSTPVRAGNYTVFEFVIAPKDRTLRELQREGKLYRQNPDVLMHRLVKFLYRYSAALQRNGEDYEPLSCLSLDTIVVGPSGQLKLLPLRAHRGYYPVEIPAEVLYGEADDRSDLFSAAYVVVEVCSAGSSRVIEPDSEAVRQCIKTFRDWRPHLTEVYTRLTDSANTVGEAPRGDCYGNKTEGEKPARTFRSLADRLTEKISGFIRSIGSRWKAMTEGTRIAEDTEPAFQSDETVRPGSGELRSTDDAQPQSTENGTFSPMR